MSCDTSPQTTSSPPIKFHTAAFTSSSPSCRKRKRGSEGDEVRPNNLRSLPRFLAQNEGIYKYMPETFSEKLKDERGLSSDPLPPITCSPQSMKKMVELQAEDYLDNYQSSQRRGQMMVIDLSPLIVKDFSIGNLMESPASLESMCNKSDDDLSTEVSRNSDSPLHQSYSKSPPTSYVQQSDPKPEILQVPRSPSDRCQNKNLRRTTLLKSLKMHDQHNSPCVLPLGRDEETEGYVVRTYPDNSTTTATSAAAVARSRLCIETLDGFLSQKCHL